jgi:hypothetical protein
VVDDDIVVYDLTEDDEDDSTEDNSTEDDLTEDDGTEGLHEDPAQAVQSDTAEQETGPGGPVDLDASAGADESGPLVEGPGDDTRAMADAPVRLVKVVEVVDQLSEAHTGVVTETVAPADPDPVSVEADE